MSLAGTAKLLAKGGKGAGCEAPDLCAAGNVTHGSPGLGATATTASTAGGDSTTSIGDGGSGGGGLGRVRVNTVDGNYTKARSTIEDAAVTTGTVQTR